MCNITLKIARIKKKMTQKDLAESVGVTSRYISQIEATGFRPSPAVMEKIAYCVGVSVQELFFSENH